MPVAGYPESVGDRPGGLRLNAFIQIDEPAVGATLARLTAEPRLQSAADCDRDKGSPTLTAK